jgi:flagellar assembly protein FliH
LSLFAVREVTSLSDRVIKSKNVELVKSSEDKSQEFIRYYSKSKGNIKTHGGEKAKAGHSSNEAIIAVKIEKAEKEAYAKGYAEGLREGTEKETRRLFQTAESLVNSMKELDRLKKDTLEGNEEKILNLVFSVSEKVINQEISLNRDVIYGVLKSAIKQTLDKEGIKVRLNPEDYQTIMEIYPGVVNSFDDIRDMIVVEDNGIRRGGVIIETSSGEVDARLDQQLHELRKAVSGKK